MVFEVGELDLGFDKPTGEAENQSVDKRVIFKGLCMVKIIAIFCLLASNAFAADPSVGSYEKYLYTSVGTTGIAVVGTQIDNIVSATPDGQSFQIKTEVNVAGRVNQTALWSLSGNYFKNTEYFIEHCAETGGKVEILKVFAGTFKACHILFHQPDQHTFSHEVWLSVELPLFILKQIRISNDASQTQVTLELVDFKSKSL